MQGRWIHVALQIYYQQKLQHFENSLEHLEETQRQRLSRIVQNLAATPFWKKTLQGKTSYEDLIQAIPLREYADYRSVVEEQRSSGREILATHVQRFEPTSGSTDKRKWIPYSKNFLAELNEGAAIWMGDTYRSFPQIKKGPHYWSLSWLPQELRALTSSDDSDLFPWWQRFFLKNLMALPP